MNLRQLSLRSFRNYEEVQLDFEPGVNLIVGDNAQGKTNLLEGLVYLGSGKSWRTQRSAELVRFGAAFAARSEVGTGSHPRREWTVEDAGPYKTAARHRI